MTFVVVRVRGPIGVRKPTADALNQLKLTRVSHAVVLEENDASKRVLNAVKDLVTWGKASEEVLALLRKRGSVPYRLNPPRKGYGGSIKLPFPKGALGDRGEEINDLVKRMIN